jgi:hypothetical protein
MPLAYQRSLLGAASTLPLAGENNCRPALHPDFCGSKTNSDAIAGRSFVEPEAFTAGADYHPSKH